jgi:hypothetical protein
MYPGYWDITGDPRYPGYRTLTIAPEPSIEWVAVADRLSDDRMGTHMIPWGLPQDSKT